MTNNTPIGSQATPQTKGSTPIGDGCYSCFVYQEKNSQQNSLSLTGTLTLSLSVDFSLSLSLSLSLSAEPSLSRSLPRFLSLALSPRRLELFYLMLLILRADEKRVSFPLPTYKCMHFHSCQLVVILDDHIKGSCKGITFLKGICFGCLVQSRRLDLTCTQCTEI